MSYDRNTFKNRVGEKIGSAFLEFYKVTLAKKAGKVKWVKHCETEVKDLLDFGLMYVLQHEVKGCRNKRKAIGEVISYIKSKDTNYQKSAEYVVKKDYGLAELQVHIDEKDTNAFWNKVEEIVNTALL